MKRKKLTGTLEFTVDWPALSNEIAGHSSVRDCPGAILGMQILNNTLYKIAKICNERGDQELLVLLEKIGAVHAN